MDLVEVGWGDVDWIGLAQNRYRWIALVKAVMKLLVPLYAGKLSMTAELLASRFELVSAVS
jgi:hypothetical protein